MTDRRVRLRGSVVGGLALPLALLGGGCTVLASRPDASTPGGSTMSDRAASLDFRSMPTREQVGMGPEGFVSYPTGSGRLPVPTTLVFPTGTLHRDFFEIDVGTNYAFALDRDERHQPTDFDFFVRAADLEHARAVLREDAAALGLSAQGIDDVRGEGTSVEQGLVRGWLSTYVSVRDAGNGDGSLNLVYTVTIGAYHNAALDKILDGNRMGLDLRTMPTAADLGFRDTYDSADVKPEPHAQLSLTLRTGAGRTTLPTDALLSNRSGTTVSSTVLLGSTTLAQGPGVARSAARTFGFDPRPALDLIGSAGPELATRNLACAATDVYTCALRLQATTAGSHAGSFTYRLTLTYR